MCEQQKRDSNDLAVLLKSLPQEDRLQVQGVIVGMQLARKMPAVETERGDKA